MIPLLALGIWVWIAKGFRTEDLPPLAIPIVLYAILSLSVSSKKVTITADGITVSSTFTERSIPFSRIDRTKVQILAERDHPVMAYIHTTEEGPPLLINLKPYRQEDVMWLVNLPAMKCSIYRGLT